MNSYIKKVCEIAEINEIVNGSKLVCIGTEKTKENKDKKVFRKRIAKYRKFELISSHTCRRSFATNIYEKFDILAIMRMTDHRSEKQFLDYIKVTPREYAERLKKFWNKSYVV